MRVLFYFPENRYAKLQNSSEVLYLSLIDRIIIILLLFFSTFLSMI